MIELRSNRYGSLDALRGVAATLVVFYHLGSYKLEPQYFPGSYLAVDFFFVLSGFVLALAYEVPLQRRLAWTSFAVKRLVRLYPLALLGAVLGIVVLLAKSYKFAHKADPVSGILVSGLLNCLMLPSFVGGAASHQETFPGNGPLWTLFLELAVNLAWAAVGVSMKTRTLAIVAAISFLALAIMTLHTGTSDLGFMTFTFLGGVARVGFGFPLGVVIYRLKDHLPTMRSKAMTPLLAAALIGVFTVPSIVLWGVPLRDLVVTLFVLPVIVVLGVGLESEGRIAAFLGRLSYPIYVLHYPVVLVMSALHQTYLSRWNHNVLAAMTVLLSVAASILASRLYDEPVRRYLTLRLSSRSTARGRDTGPAPDLNLRNLDRHG